jgi:hypothetical protein
MRQQHGNQAEHPKLCCLASGACVLLYGQASVLMCYLHAKQARQRVKMVMASMPVDRPRSTDAIEVVNVRNHVQMREVIIMACCTGCDAAVVSWCSCNQCVPKVSRPMQTGGSVTLLSVSGSGIYGRYACTNAKPTQECSLQ